MNLLERVKELLQAINNLFNEFIANIPNMGDCSMAVPQTILDALNAVSEADNKYEQLRVAKNEADVAKDNAANAAVDATNALVAQGEVRAAALVSLNEAINAEFAD
jgi:hypothetical protein